MVLKFEFLLWWWIYMTLSCYTKDAALTSVLVLIDIIECPMCAGGRRVCEARAPPTAAASRTSSTAWARASSSGGKCWERPHWATSSFPCATRKDSLRCDFSSILCNVKKRWSLVRIYFSNLCLWCRIVAKAKEAEHWVSDWQYCHHQLDQIIIRLRQTT